MSVSVYMQAWSETTTKLLGWRARDDNPMPNPTEQKFHISIQRHRPRGHVVVACSCRLPPCNSSWRLDHPSEIRSKFLSVSQTWQGNPHCYRFVYESLQLQIILLLVTNYVFFQSWMVGRGPCSAGKESWGKNLWRLASFTHNQWNAWRPQ